MTATAVLTDLIGRPSVVLTFLAATGLPTMIACTDDDDDSSAGWGARPDFSHPDGGGGASSVGETDGGGTTPNGSGGDSGSDRGELATTSIECPYEDLGGSATASLVIDHSGGTAAASYLVVLAGLSALSEISINPVSGGGQLCDITPKPAFTSTDPCNDLWQCGPCQILIHHDAARTSGAWVMGLWNEEASGCSQYNAVYWLEPSGGGSGGPSPCSDCLSTCQGLPSCCTGSGCMCESECSI